MALEDIQRKYIPRDNSFYRDHYNKILMGVMAGIFFLILLVSIVIYQVLNRPIPPFTAIDPEGKTMVLRPDTKPNLLPDTIIRWASKAATLSYTFDFVNFNKQMELARPYFTEDGWRDFQSSIQGLISTIVQNQLFVNGVVAGTPVISNQGPLPGQEYVWRVQIPFLVTYQTADTSTKKDFLVSLTIVKISTNLNPQGIGIDQFVMR